jgi:hypothetical protein
MSWLAADDGDLERRRFNDAAFDLWRGRPDQDLTPPKDICRDALAIINYSAVEKLGREPAAFERRRIAVRASNGYDNMDLAGWGGARHSRVRRARLRRHGSRRSCDRADAGPDPWDHLVLKWREGCGFRGRKGSGL